ncbi:MAG: glutaredoxin family protein [Trichormus sp. ATA11-4-KO1]|jgi:glutaredoxin|nr:glutaredoxin family protein [Trichormus sp. ATA11-4-KO1]
MRLILYSKPGCHLCEGLQEKLEQIQNLSFELEVRDISTREDWFGAYQYEVPVLYLSNYREATAPCGFPDLFAKRLEEKQVACVEEAEKEKDVIEERLPRPSPRASVQQLEQMLRKYLSN